MRRLPPARVRAAAAAVAAVTVIVVVGACSHAQAMADWVDKADAICRSAQANADNNPAPQSPLPGDALRLSATRSRQELDDLRDLDKPTEQSSAVEEYLITLGRRNDALERYATELDKAPAQGAPPDRTSLEDVTNQAYTQAVALGLEDCAGGVDFSVDTTTTSTTAAVGAPTTTPGPTGVVGQPDGQEVTQDEPAPTP